MRRLLTLLALLACAAFGADLTGKWTGTADFKAPDGNTESGPAVVTLKHAGDTITGTAGPNEDEALPIEKPKFDGKKLTFEIHTPNGRLIKLALDLVENDKLEGSAEVERDDGEKATGTVKLQKS